LDSDHGERIFVHLNDVAGRRELRPGQRVSFADGTDRLGRPCATRVNLIGAPIGK
jgi:cold shock CspA family protein